MHEAVKEWVRVNLPREFDSVVEVGSRDINGSLRSLFVGKEYVGVDILPGENVDLVADAAQPLPLPNNKFDVAVCIAVFEHTPDTAAIIKSMTEVMRPGGKMLLMAAYQWPAHSAIDGGWALHPGEYYANIPESDLNSALADAGLSDWKVVVQGMDIYAVAIK